jgi:signal transduction histidine kinase
MLAAPSVELLDAILMPELMRLLAAATGLPVTVVDQRGEIVAQAGGPQPGPLPDDARGAFLAELAAEPGSPDMPAPSPRVLRAGDLQVLATRVCCGGQSVATLLAGPFGSADDELGPGGRPLRTREELAGLSAHCASFVAVVASLCEARRQSDEVVWTLLGANRDGAALLDAESRVVAANEALARAVGKSVAELCGTDLLAYLPAEEADQHRRHLAVAIQTGEPVRVTGLCQSPGSVTTWYPVRDGGGTVSRVAFVACDALPRPQADRPQHLAALGQFAGGVAHEFNNLLCSLWLNADLAESRGGRADLETLCEVVREGARRGGSVCDDLLTFAQPAAPRRRCLAPEAPVEAALAEALRQLTAAGVEVERRYACPQAMISADSDQLRQVYSNLISNAHQAMPHGGTLTLSTDFEQTPDGARVVVRVRDTGVGIPSEHLPRIFEPFFTTKGSLGQSEVPGMGLGLAVAHGLVTAQEGTIRATSRWGEGTTVELRFPVLPGAPSWSAATPATPLRGAPGPGPKILVAEDEASLREVIRDTLTQEGYEVRATAAADEAVAALAEARYDLVITDLLMPGGGGMTVLAAAVALPEAPRLLVITGKTGEGLERELLAAGAQGVLRKPFGVADVLQAAKRLLEQP